MQQRLLITAVIIGALIMSAAPAKANFLGLAPGDYTLTLLNSTAFCGGVNCTGTVHIGASGATGFDWNFTIAGDVFDFNAASPTLLTDISPNQLNSCVSEAKVGGGFCDATDSGVSTFTQPRGLTLRHDVTAALMDTYVIETQTSGILDNWVVTPIAVPEPLSSTLFLFGLGALGIWRTIGRKD